MQKNLIALIAGLAISSSSLASNAICNQPVETVFLQYKLSYEVAGTERLHFHTGPDIKCLDKKVFVIPGDVLVAYEESEHGEWTNVSYLSKSGKDYSGWVPTKRLKFLGASGEMSPEVQMYFKKAAESAKAGRLGRP